MSPEPVRVFSLSTCYHCKTIRKMLEKYSVPAEYLELDLMDEEKRDAALEELKSRIEGRSASFPTLFIGDRVVEGAKHREILEALEARGMVKLGFLARWMAKIAGDR